METNGIQPSDGHDPRPLKTVAAQVAIVWTATSAPCDVPHLKHFKNNFFNQTLVTLVHLNPKMS